MLADTERGSELRLDSVCKVHIPLIGGKLEKMVMQHIERVFDDEEDFMAYWISKQH